MRISDWSSDVCSSDLLDTYVASGIVALTVYTSTFVCEALRSGVNAVLIGQAEAARAIGMPFAGTMRHVIIPQAFRASVPPLASVQIALLKNPTRLEERRVGEEGVQTVKYRGVP